MVHCRLSVTFICYFNDFAATGDGVVEKDTSANPTDPSDLVDGFQEVNQAANSTVFAQRNFQGLEFIGEQVEIISRSSYLRVRCVASQDCYSVCVCV